MSKKMTLGVIGCGNMGTAILSRIHKDYDIYVCEKNKQRSVMLRRRYKVKTVDLSLLASSSKIIFLAVKPQDLEGVLADLKKYLKGDEIIVSIVAGITCSYIEKRLKGKPRVIRSMPNLPVQIGQGIAGVCKGKYAKPFDLKMALKILGFVGETVTVEERLIDSITAVSGSGPAYLFYLVEEFIKSAKSLGLKGSMSQKLVMKTLKGSLELMEKTREPAEILRKKVTSKGGTTQAALDVLNKKGFDKIFREAVTAAKKRAKQLSK